MMIGLLTPDDFIGNSKEVFFTLNGIDLKTVVYKLKDSEKVIISEFNRVYKLNSNRDWYWHKDPELDTINTVYKDGGIMDNYHYYPGAKTVGLTVQELCDKFIGMTTQRRFLANGKEIK